MKILLLGSGSREHAFAWKIKQSPLLTDLFILPGNGGTDSLGTNIPGSVNNFPLIKQKVIELGIDLVLVGPEEPLILGVKDFFEFDPEISKVPVIGPRKGSAELEGSKDFSKQFMMSRDIPTASYKTFTHDEIEEGIDYIRNHSLPIVLKADGLAAGKGVLICSDYDSAIKGFLEIIQDKKFGKSGDKVVIESFLDGIEMSLFVLTDGKSYKILPEAKDYKKIGEGDKGLNTGGMGSVSPVPFFDDVLKDKINTQIVVPTLEGLREEGIEYFGFLFIGLMIVDAEPWVIEYNVRMGDPETQSVLPRIETDFLELLKAVADQNLDTIRMKTSPLSAVTMVSVSGGYPEDFKNGFPIQFQGPLDSNQFYFQGGTIMDNGILKTNGGRVISATALGENLNSAREKAMKASENIIYEGRYFRKDIGLDIMK